MKKILSLIAVFTAIGLYAGETTVEKLHEHYLAEANKTDNTVVKSLEKKASEPTQEMKNLNEAVERLANGKASEADKELIKSVDEPSLKKLQNATVYAFTIGIDDPSYHFLASGSSLLPKLFASIIDLYMIQHCTNDLSKTTPEDFKNIGVSGEYGQLMYMEYGAMGTTVDAYKKYIQAVRAFNCGDQKALLDYIDVETVDATVLTNYDTQNSAPQIMYFSFQNKKGMECYVFGEAYKFKNGKFGIDLKKQKCENGDESVVHGYVAPNVEKDEKQIDITFSSLNVGDKVKITKSK